LIKKHRRFQNAKLQFDLEKQMIEERLNIIRRWGRGYYQEDSTAWKKFWLFEQPSINKHENIWKYCKPDKQNVNELLHKKNDLI